MNLNNTKTEEKTAMRKLYGSIATIMLAVLVLAGGTTTVRGQNFLAYPTLSLRNFHVPPGDGQFRVSPPIDGADRYFLVPIWIWNQVDTTQNPNNSWDEPPFREENPGQHLEPVRSFKFQLWYNNEAMELDTLHGSPVVMTGPSLVSVQSPCPSVTPQTDTALAASFFVTFSDQSAGFSGNPFAHTIRLAGASSVPLPMNASPDSGYHEHNGILLWLRFHVIVAFAAGGEMVLDSAQFNDHWGDTGYSQPGSNFSDNGDYVLVTQGNTDMGPAETIGNFGGGTGIGDNDRGTLNISYSTAPPMIELRPVPNVAILNDQQGDQYDSLVNDLVYDPTVLGIVSQAVIIDDATGSTELDNTTITSDQPWLTIDCNAPGGGSNSLFLGWDGVDNLGLNPQPTLEGSPEVTLYLSVQNPQNLAPGVYYATVTFQNATATNAPLPLIVRFVREEAPDEPTQPGSGIQLQISNSCINGVTNLLTFGTGPDATDSLDELYGEQVVPNSAAVPNSGTAFAYFYPQDLNLQNELAANNDAGYNRDIRNDNTDTTLIYQVNFNPGNVNCYPVKVCVDPTQFPTGARVLMLFTLNGSGQPIDLRNATLFNGLECVTITDQRINTFYIEYTPGTIANLASFIKPNSWSLISLPVIPPNPSSSVIFGNALTTPYQYQASSGWEQQGTLEFGRGYMLRYGTFIGTDATVAGVKSYSVSNVQISEGWNSIGGTSSNGTFGTGFGTQIDGTVITFTPPTLGGTVPNDLPYMWQFTPQVGYTMTNFFIPGQGYFIKVDNPGFWNITTPTPTTLPGSTIPVNHSANTATASRDNLQGQLTQALFNDADGNGQTLYFGNATTNEPESNFEMPGKFSSFDARFDANSGMISYNHASYVVNVHAASYPVTMKVKNTSGSVTVSDMNGNLIGTADNNGIVTISNPGITQVQIAEKQTDAPNMVGYSLEANSPNPFTQSTAINYSLPQESVVSLVVYNQLGQVVQTLVNGTVGAGEQEALFDGSQLPSGSYYYTLKAGSFVQTQRMTLQH
jgi:hypothetical protein